MKTMILSFILLGFATAAVALEPADLDNRIRTLTEKFDAYQHRPDVAIPADVLRRAKGIVLLDRTKAGFLFAYQGGGGVAMVRDSKLGKWSPVAFLAANQASLGFQIGAEQNFYIILMMTTNATALLTDPKYEFGGDARGTAGDVAGGVGVNRHVPNDESILIYDDHKGLYGGATVKAGAITPDDQANRMYYGEYATIGDILFGGKIAPTEPAVRLATKVDWYSHALEGPKTVENKP